MFIAVAAYQIAYRGMGAAAANDCSQNKPQQIVFVLHYILYMSCDLQIMANLQKKYRTRVFISRKLTHMLLCVLIFTCGLMPSCFNSGTSNSVLPPYLHCPSQYHVCVLLQWCTLHGISVLLYVESTFVQPLSIITHHALPFCPPKSPKNTCAREKNQSEQQKIRSLITENPPSRNRKSRFASALITIHRPPFSAPALMSLSLRRSLRQ